MRAPCACTKMHMRFTEASTSSDSSSHGTRCILERRLGPRSFFKDPARRAVSLHCENNRKGRAPCRICIAKVCGREILCPGRKIFNGRCGEAAHTKAHA